jgi:hypothetical protein
MAIANTFRRRAIQGLLAAAVAASALGGAGAASAATSGSTQLSVTIEALDNTASRDDGIDSYRLVVVNRGGDLAKGVTITLPFQPEYRLAGASFTQNDAWVSRNGSGSAEIRIEEMRGVDDTAVGTLQFVSSGAASANALTSRVSARWSDGEDSYSTTSNLPLGGASLNYSSSGQSDGGLRYTFSGSSFAANEPVNFWYTNAAGASTALVVDEGVLVRQPADDDDDDDEDLAEYVGADDQGALSAGFSTSGLPSGSYTLAARGGWSGLVASISFVVP